MEPSFAGKIKEMGMGRGVGQGENSPCCLHALGLEQGTVKPPQAVPCPVSFLKRQSAPLPSPSQPRHGCEIQGEQQAHPSHAAGDAKGHPKRVYRTPQLPPGTLSPTHSMEMGQRDEGQLGQCRSRTSLWEQGGVGPDSGEQLLLELSGTDWGPTACRDRPSPAPYRGERKLLYLFCVGKTCFFTVDRAPVTGSR